VFLLNSRHHLVTATSLGSWSKSIHLTEAHLLPKLRCQFAEFLRLGSLKRLGILSPPTCVGLRYGLTFCSTRGFSWKHGIIDLAFFCKNASLSPLGLKEKPFYRISPAYGLQPQIQSVAQLPFFVPARFNAHVRCWNINQLSIAYALRPQLRTRLTPGGLTCPGKP
jgi:hypothetical protein